MTWPVSQELGVQLGYGLEGSLLYLSNSEDEKLVFAKEREQGISLHSAYKDSETLIPTQRSSRDSKVTRNSPQYRNVDNAYVPNDVLKFLEDESHLLLQVYDPTVKQLMAIGRTKKMNAGPCIRAIAFASGALGNLLTAALIAFDRDLSVHLMSCVSLEIPSIIKQVVIGDLFDASGRGSCPYLLIRSDTTVYIVKFSRLKNYDIKLTLYHEIKFKKNIVDVSFNPWRPDQFAMIDSKGKFYVRTVRTLNPASPSLNASSLMVNPIELSSFKLITWGNDANSVILVDRSSVQKYNIVTGKIKTFIVLNSFSSIKDYSRINDEHAILLTSKEIILLQTTGKSFNRLISWKHSLDAEDPSLKLRVANLTNVNLGKFLYHCTVFSSFNNLTINIQFGLKDGLIKVLGDPYMSLVGQDSSTNEMFILPYLDFDLILVNDRYYVNDIHVPLSNDEVYFAAFRFSASLELSVSYYTSRFRAPPAKPQIDAPSNNNNNTGSISPPPFSDMPLGFEGLFNRLTVGEDHLLLEGISESQSQEVQRIAYHLSTRLDTYIKSGVFEAGNLSLSSDFLDGITDIEEVDSMIEQLVEHFSSEGLSFSTNLFFTTESPDEHPCGCTLRWLLSAGCDDEKKAAEAAIKLALSQITFTLSADLSSSLEDLLDDFPKDIKSIISKWDNAGEDEEEVIPESYKIPSSFLMPSINISQPYPNLLHRDFATQMPAAAAIDSQSSQGDSQPTQAISQVERGVHGGRTALKKKKKKKKKKLGGFN